MTCRTSRSIIILNVTTQAIQNQSTSDFIIKVGEVLSVNCPRYFFQEIVPLNVYGAWTSSSTCLDYNLPPRLSHPRSGWSSRKVVDRASQPPTACNFRDNCKNRMVVIIEPYSKVASLGPTKTILQQGPILLNSSIFG